MKHVGKMKNNSARVAVAYRTLPGEPTNALVIGTQGLPDAYHDTLMSLIESEAGQGTNELAEILATRRFPDGVVMLEWLHTRGHLKKVPTNLVLMTPNSQTQIPLNELNQIIADQKGVSVEDLAVTDGSQKPKKKTVTSEVQEILVEDNPPVMTAADLRSKADALYKEAARLRKEADALEPPKKRTTKKIVTE